MDFTAVMPRHVETIFFFTRRQIACVSALLPRQLDTLAIEGERRWGRREKPNMVQSIFQGHEVYVKQILECYRPYACKLWLFF